MPLNVFRPRPGRYGTMLVTTSFSNYSTMTLTANTSNLVRVPTPPSYCRLAKLSIQTGTLAADADGTVVATAYKYVAGSSDTTLNSSTVNLETLTANQPGHFTITASESGRKFNKTSSATDQLVVDIVNNSAAIDTQPKDVTIVAEWEILK